MIDKKDNQTTIGNVDVGPYFSLIRRCREYFFLMFVLIASYIILSLLSYNPVDPSWLYWGEFDGTVVNQGGYIGAWLADGLFTLCGSTSWFIPLGLLIFGFRILYIHYSSIFSGGISILTSFFGFLLCICISAAVLDLFDVEWEDGLIYGGGGWIGNVATEQLFFIFGFHGTLLVLLGSGLIGITLYTGVSWYSLGTQCCHFLVKILQFGKKLFAKLFFYIEKIYITLRSCVFFLKKCIAFLVDWISVCYIWFFRLIKKSRIKENELDKLENKLVAESSSQEYALNVESAIEELGISQMEDDGKNNTTPRLDNKKVRGKSKVAVLKPALSLLDKAIIKKRSMGIEERQSLSQLLEYKLKDFGVQVTVESVNPGPVITRLEIQPAPGIKASRISGLASDLARAMMVPGVRVVEVIPGKSVIGIEVPNSNRETVLFSDVVTTSVYKQAESPLSLVLGQDIEGKPVIVDLARMPHLLVAGTTGSGKSVGVNAMLLSMLFKANPEEVRMIMIDPKMLELSVYDGIPHLLTPVVTDMKEAAGALRWCVAEMERRYRLMAAVGVRNISGFNRKVEEGIGSGTPLKDPLYKGMVSEAPELWILPFIVVVIDEFADMMMIVGKKVEELIARIAQKARAAGIHMILATQRPSVDVITGLIKANIPTRISFQVSSKIDSRTIIDQGGAEQLLGQGDMLYLPPGLSIPIRVHGAFVSDDEVHRVVSDWKMKMQSNYIGDVLSDQSDSEAHVTKKDMEQDPLYDEVVAFVIEKGKASISGVQRQFRIGYNRSARIVEAMEAAGILGEAGSGGFRDVLIPKPG